MATKVRDILLATFVVMLCVGCGGAGRKVKAESNAQPAVKEFRLPEIPSSLQGEAAREYLRDHMWDNFDFSDTLQISTLDRDLLMRVFLMYVVPMTTTEAQIYLPQLMQKASVSKPMFEYFLSLAERVLHDPNSPVRDDEKYIPLLQYVVASNVLDEYEKMPYEHDLKIAQQNRLGHKAADFAFTTADGCTRRLWDLKANYTLIFISNPDCPMCRDVREQILASAIISEVVNNGILKIVVIYPDTDLILWREHLQDYPASWINAYDKGQVISSEELYDLRAIPAMYLLDEQKRVLAKDCTDVGYIENLIVENKSL